MKLLSLTLLATSLLCVSTLCAQSTYKSTLPVKPKKGITVAGTVECDGKPVAGVTISDGYEVTKTDKKGAYYLKSKKQNPQVFISIPSGYEAWQDDVMPQFWADFTLSANEYERLDFRLNKVDNKNHAMLFVTDIHLANQRNDVAIFSNEYVERLRKEADRLKAEGKRVYTMHLGDGTWDLYWYAHKYPIGEMRNTLNKADYPTPFFNVMGNHDNDGAVIAGPDADLQASLPYQKAFGPRYYSFNAGDVHYVVLDNIEYINTPAQSNFEGIKGKRNYNENFTPEQLEWLRKDLTDIPYDTPIVIGMHSPALRWTNNQGTAYKLKTEKESTRELMSILKPYKDVHAFSGHSHRQCIVRTPAEEQNLTDHNISGTCGAWWRTSATGLKNLCPDGTPAAFELFTADGKDLKWKHLAYEYPEDRTFYAWDMNSIKDYMQTSGEARAFKNLYPKWTDYSDVPDNYVYVNLWAWDPEGKLTITENGKELPVEIISQENPLFLLSYMLRTTLWMNIVDSKGAEKPRKFQLFRAKASAPDTPVEISWTDYFGNETRQTLSRPTPFSLEYR